MLVPVVLQCGGAASGGVLRPASGGWCSAAPALSRCHGGMPLSGAGRTTLGTEPARIWCMTFELDFGHTSQAGRKEVNEDFAALVLGQGRDRERGAIAAIADGVSTGGNGREAAQTSVNTLVNDYFATPDTWDTTVARDRIVSAHNGWLASMKPRRHPGVGLSTLTALVLCGQSFTLAQVGDTRAYLVREGRLHQLTTDHVMAQHDLRHQLTRAMGLDDHVVVDYSQGELRQLLRQENPAQALTDELVQVALRRGSSDNVTALVVRVQGALEATLQDESRRAQGVFPAVRLAFRRPAGAAPAPSPAPGRGAGCDGDRAGRARAGLAAPPGRGAPRHQARQPAPGRRRGAACAGPGRGPLRPRARGHTPPARRNPQLHEPGAVAGL